MDEDALRGLDPRADPQLQRRVMLPINFSKSTCIPIIFQKKDTCFDLNIFLLQHKAIGIGHKFNNLDRPLPYTNNLYIEI